MAAQFTATKGPSALREWAWIRRAIISFPEPLSPVMRMPASVLDTLSVISISRFTAEEEPMISRSTPLARIRSSRTSVAKWRRSRALSTERRSWSRWKGFPMKSYAPLFIAFTAVSTLPKAVMTRTGISGACFLMRRRTSI
ncbi:MAG: hypothetical protein H6Q79_2289, partial [Deltaproteobacteria bacterium]|nr:hypothetical protein [Deltaproteobacteria bacterium]